MNMLAAPDTITGPLTAADLDEARAYSTGRIYRLHRIHCEPGAVVSDDDCERMACAPEGGKHAEPVPSAQKKRDINGARIGFVLLLLSATTVIGVISAAVLARWPMAWPLG